MILDLVVSILGSLLQDFGSSLVVYNAFLLAVDIMFYAIKVLLVVGKSPSGEDN